MKRLRITKIERALLGSALFICAGLAVCAPAPRVCAPDGIDGRASVDYVHDGDTVRLEGFGRARLIGLDAPEIGRDDKADEPYAQQARQALQSLLDRHGDRVALRYGRERRDDYGRLLAHLYLPDDSSVTAYLLRRGLATALTVPPNAWNLDCYRAAEAEARAAGRGIWSLPKYQVIESVALPRGVRGFRRVRGEIVRVGESRCCVWLNLEGGVALRIERRDLEYFPRGAFEDAEGKTITARGWIYERDGELRIPIRHPAALEAAE